MKKALNDSHAEATNKYPNCCGFQASVIVGWRYIPQPYPAATFSHSVTWQHRKCLLPNNMPLRIIVQRLGLCSLSISGISSTASLKGSQSTTRSTPWLDSGSQISRETSRLATYSRYLYVLFWSWLWALHMRSYGGSLSPGEGALSTSSIPRFRICFS